MVFVERYITKVIVKVNWDIGSKMSSFLATGNLVSPSGLDLQQASGFTIVAEKLNWMRYISHFRCIHRGAFFAQLKTTTVRKLLPEAWGKVVRSSHSGPLLTIIQVFCVQCTRLMVPHVVCSIIFRGRAALSRLLFPLLRSLHSWQLTA
jgi:hypothetical protein